MICIIKSGTLEVPIAAATTMEELAKSTTSVTEMMQNREFDITPYREAFETYEMERRSGVSQRKMHGKN